MHLIAKGKQASVYLTSDGKVLWVPDQSNRNEHVLTGWQLCEDRLARPHFPEVYEVSPKGVLMEYVTGDKPEVWNEGQATQILNGLRQANIFHRDIRLVNLKERPDSNWCLLDFGWACDSRKPYPAPWFLGAEGRMAKGIQNDAYAMQIVKQRLYG